MAPIKGDYEDDNDDDEAVPLVTAVTNPTNNGIRSTVSSSFQVEGNEEKNGVITGTNHPATKTKVMSKHQQSRLRYILICAVVSILVVLYSKRKNTTSSVDESQITPTTGTVSSKRHHSKTVKPKMTLQSLRVLQQSVLQAHEKFTQQLQEQ